MATEFDLPEGFTLVSDTQEDSGASFELPEGFEVVTETKEPTSSLAGMLQGDPTSESPFVSGQQEVTPQEPQLDLVGQRTIDPSLSPAEIRAAQADVIRSNYENVFSQYSTGAKTIGGLFNTEMREEAEEEVKTLRQGLAQELAERGFEGVRYTDDGELYITHEGQEIQVDGSVLRDIANSVYEFGGAVSGGAAGASLGSMAGPIGAIAGGVVGSMGGASGGRYLDILANKADLVSSVEDEFIYDQVKEAGLLDLVGTTAAASLYKFGEKAIAKPIKKLYNLVFDKNIDGAFEHAKTHFNISDDEAMDLVRKFEQTIQPLEGTDKEKAIKVLATTKPGGEAVVKMSDIFDPTASAQVANDVFKRAEDVRSAAKELSADNITGIFKDTLGNYTNLVKSNYRALKDAGAQTAGDYTFDYNKLGIQPILDDIGSKIENPTIKQRYADLLTKVENVAEGRQFDDLVDLRQLVNEVKFSTKSIKETNKKALDKILGSIDGEINRVAKDILPEGDKWLKAWDKSKKDYSEMKGLEKNVMYKALTKPGLSEDQVINTLKKYITAEDNTFYEVIEKLSPKVRNRFEGAILDTLTEKFSLGEIGGNRAIQFPALAQELNKLKLTGGKAKQFKRSVNRMADIFKNDVNLARVAGNLTIPKHQSYLTTDPVVRLKYELASSMFNYVKQLVPGDKANALALLNNTASLLENPLSDKSIKELYRQLPKDTANFKDVQKIDELVKQMQDMYVNRREQMKKIYDADNVPPRLVWKRPQSRIAPKETLPTGDTLSATERGTISPSATKAVMQDRTDDLISQFVQSSANGSNEAMGRVTSMLDNRRYKSIKDSVSGQLSMDNAKANMNTVMNVIQREAKVLQDRIQKDLGVQMPAEQAEKLIKAKYREMLEDAFK